MPSTYAHRRFGTNVLEHLPDELRAQLEQNRELYDIGLHGPDLLFYYHAAKSNPVGALGNAMHEEPGRVFFDRARRVVHCEADRDAALAYALGFVCHFALDSTCHPYVERFTRESGVTPWKLPRQSARWPSWCCDSKPARTKYSATAKHTTISICGHSARESEEPRFP